MSAHLPTLPPTVRLPRPTPGAMPEPRAYGAVWVAWGTRYVLRRVNRELAAVDVQGDDVQTWMGPLRIVDALHVTADVAALVHWLSRGGR